MGSSTFFGSVVLLWTLLLVQSVQALCTSPRPRPGYDTSVMPSFIRDPYILPGQRGGPVSARVAKHRGAIHMATPTSAASDKERARGSSPNEDYDLTRKKFIAAVSFLGFSQSIYSRVGIAPSYDITLERIFDTRRRSFLPAEPEQLLSRGLTQRVVCLGETHTHPLHHRMQFNVIKAAHAITKDRGEPLAVGLEMFYRQQQVRQSRVARNCPNTLSTCIHVTCRCYRKQVDFCTCTWMKSLGKINPANRLLSVSKAFDI